MGLGVVELLLILVVVGFICWLVLTYVPMPSPFKEVFVFIVIMLLIVLILQSVGLIHTGLHL